MNLITAQSQPGKPPKSPAAPISQPAPTPIYIPTAPVTAAAVTKVADANADTRGDNEEVAKRKQFRPETVDRIGTILTGGQGVTTSAPTAKKTLLGG